MTDTNNQQPTPLLLEYLERIFYWCRALDVAAQIDEQRGDEDYQWPIDAVLLDDPDQIIDQIRALSSLGSQTDVDAAMKILWDAGFKIHGEFGWVQNPNERGLLKTGEKKKCMHSGYSFRKHGRCCPHCDKFLVDFGD